MCHKAVGGVRAMSGSCPGSSSALQAGVCAAHCCTFKAPRRLPEDVNRRDIWLKQSIGWRRRSWSPSVSEEGCGFARFVIQKALVCFLHEDTETGGKQYVFSLLFFKKFNLLAELPLGCSSSLQQKLHSRSESKETMWHQSEVTAVVQLPNTHFKFMVIHLIISTSFWCILNTLCLLHKPACIIQTIRCLVSN